MLSRRYVPKVVLLLAAALILPACGDDDDDQTPGVDTAELRVIHASYDAPAVAVLVDGEQAISSLSYGSSSGYQRVPSGQRAIAVRPAAGGEAVLQATLDLETNTRYSVFAFGQLDTISAGVAPDLKTAETGKAAVRFVHASPDAPAVDVKVGAGDGPAVFSNVSFEEIADYIMVDPGSVSLVVTPAGSSDVVVAYEPVSLEAGQIYTVVALGTLSASDAVDFVARVFIDTSTGVSAVDLQPVGAGNTAEVRVIHATYDAPAVAVAVDDEQAIPSLAYGESSGYQELPSGERAIAVSPAAGGAAVLEATLDLAADTRYSVFAFGPLDTISAGVAADLKTVEAGMAAVRFVHGAPDAPAVDIKVGDGEGPSVFSNIPFKTISDYVMVDPGSVSLVVTPAGSADVVVAYQPVTLEAGQIYTVIALGTLSGDDAIDFVARVFIDTGDGASSVDLQPTEPFLR